jgi:hypothetical protein
MQLIVSQAARPPRDSGLTVDLPREARKVNRRSGHKVTAEAIKAHLNCDDDRSTAGLRSNHSVRSTGRLWVVVGTLAVSSIDAMQHSPLCLKFFQVRGLIAAPESCGQGRGRTADLPLFRGSIPLYDHDLVSITQPSSPA